MTARLVTDVGGQPAGKIPLEERPQLFWEKQMIATFNLLRAKGILAGDDYRRKTEEMPYEAYANSTFYGRRADGVAKLLVEKGVLTEDEIEARTKEILRRGTRDHL